jgi:hypothetical protein
MVVVAVAVMKRMGILDRFPPERERVAKTLSFKAKNLLRNR